MKVLHIGGSIRPRASSSGHVLFKWVLFGFLVVLVAAGFVLMMEHQTHQDELARVREESAQEVRLASEEVERLKVEAAQAAPAPDITELVKLRGEVAELRRQQQQWQRTVAENRQLNATVRQWAQAATEGAGRPANAYTVAPPLPAADVVPAEGVNVGNLGDNDDPADVARAIPGAAPTRTQKEKEKDSLAAACILNLQGIAGAKSTWTLEYHKQPTDVPQEAELFGLNKHLSQKPVCPGGGVYTMGAVGEKPRCNMPGHEL